MNKYHGLSSGSVTAHHLPHSKFPYSNSSVNIMILRGGALGSKLGHGGEVPKNELSALS